MKCQPGVERRSRAASELQAQRDPRYWFKRETLHNLMEPLIDSELAPKLRAIVPAEVREQRRQARDAARYVDHNTGKGVRAGNEQKRAQARILRAAGKSQREIAAALGVALRTAQRWLA